MEGSNYAIDESERSPSDGDQLAVALSGPLGRRLDAHARVERNGKLWMARALGLAAGSNVGFGAMAFVAFLMQGFSAGVLALGLLSITAGVSYGVLLTCPERLAAGWSSWRATNDLSEADVAAWVAALPPLSDQGKRDLSDILLKGEIDLDDVAQWIDDEIARRADGPQSGKQARQRRIAALAVVVSGKPSAP